MKLLSLIRRLFFKSIYEGLYNKITTMQYCFKQQHSTSNGILKKYYTLRVFLIHRKIFHQYACDITPSSQLGNVIFRHPLGIVIGGGAKLADGVIVHQNVTLGALQFDEKTRRGVDCSQIVGENTIICCGAKILGDVTIGKNCIIGANAIVTKDIPDNSVVVGVNKIVE